MEASNDWLKCFARQVVSKIIRVNDRNEVEVLNLAAKGVKEPPNEAELTSS